MPSSRLGLGVRALHGRGPGKTFVRWPLGLTLLVLVALGIYCRRASFGYPSTFLFDEHHFVENARNYMGHARDENDHPPLGKIVIAAFMLLLGDNPTGWRSAAFASGLLTLAVGGLAAARLFRAPWAGFLVTALLAADGFFIAYSRAALLDGFLAVSILAALLLATFRVSWLTATLAGVLAGVAMNIKFSGVGVLPPLVLAGCLAPLSTPKKGLLGTLLFAVTFATYVAFYSYGLSVARSPTGISGVIADTTRLLVHHAELTDMKNPLTSGWSTWGLPTRPILMGVTRGVDGVRALTSLGNLAIWWPSVLLAAVTVATIAWQGVRATLHPPLIPPPAGLGVNAFVAEHGAAVLLVLSGAAGYLAPWVLTHRDSYIYHFLPIYGCLVVLLGGYLGWLQKRSEKSAFVVLCFVVVVLLVAAFYAPVWSFMPISERALRWRLFLGGWR